MPHKNLLVANILRQLGHEVPDNKTLDDAIIEAAREYKVSKGLSPGPEVNLSLIALPGISLSQSKKKE